MQPHFLSTYYLNTIIFSISLLKELNRNHDDLYFFQNNLNDSESYGKIILFEENCHLNPAIIPIQ